MAFTTPLSRLQAWARRLAPSHGRASFDPGGPEFGARRRELVAAISQLSEANARLHREARTDALTGLRNRRALAELEHTVLGTPACPWHEAAILFIDIDRFGDFNHLYGDQAGDAALARVAQALVQAGRETDAVFRKGGEEFVVILADAADVTAKVAERYRDAVAALAIPHSANGRGILTATIGVVAARPGMRIERCLIAAGNAVMAAKLGGRRDCVFYPDVIDGEVLPG